jgi:hypothetical protein
MKTGEFSIAIFWENYSAADLERERIKRQTIANRRLQHHAQAA